MMHRDLLNDRIFHPLNQIVTKSGLPKCLITRSARATALPQIAVLIVTVLTSHCKVTLLSKDILQDDGPIPRIIEI